jgi:outer membrane protein OmpA-like peptidoglycan-associated protein
MHRPLWLVLAFGALVGCPETTEALAQRSRCVPVAHFFDLKTHMIAVDTGIHAVVKRKQLEPAKLQGSVEFAPNSAGLTPEALQQLQTISALFSETGDYWLVIAGHIDASEAAELGEGLSNQRASAVREQLLKIPRQSAAGIVTIGFGIQRLATPARPGHRRVEIYKVWDKPCEA